MLPFHPLKLITDYAYRRVWRLEKFYKGNGLPLGIDPFSIHLSEEVISWLNANPKYSDTYERLGSVSSAYLFGRGFDDWTVYRKIIPSNTKSILDIGSGLGVLDLFLYYGLNKPQITLVDKATREQEGKTYSVTDLAKKFQTENGVPTEKLRILDAQDPNLQNYLKERKYDCIISTRGLGMLFPYSLYQNTIRDTLSPSGVLILDIIHGKKELDKFSSPVRDRFEKEGFPNFESVLNDLKSDFKSNPEIVMEGPMFSRVLVKRGL